MNRHSTQQGFTIIELMIVTVIIAITAVFAIPAFDTFFKSNRMRASEGDIATAMQFARAEALRRGTSVYLSAIDASVNTNEWGNGLRVWVDNDGDGAYDAGEELREVGSFHNSMTLNGSDGVSTIIFRPTGLTNLAASLTIEVCDDRTAETGRLLTMLRTGVLSTNSAHACL